MNPGRHPKSGILSALTAFVAAMTAFYSPAANPAEESPATAIPMTVEETGAETYSSATEVVEAVKAIGEPVDSTAADFFVNAPISIFPTIDKITRMDMIDYFRAGSEKPSRNLIGGECRITWDSPEKLVVSTSKASEYTIALLPAPSAKLGKIIMLSRTLKTPADDSSVTFYDTDWNELPELLSMPDLGQWILPEARKNRKDIENSVPFLLARLEYSPDNLSVTFTNTLSEYLPQESLEIAASSIRKSLTYKWNGKRFVLER